MVPTIEIFDPRLGLWMLGEPMNYCRGYSGAAAIGEKIFVIGGVNESDKILDTVHLPCYTSVTFYVSTVESQPRVFVFHFFSHSTG